MKRLGLGLLYAVLAAGVALLGGYLAVSLVVEKAPEVSVPPVAGLTLSGALDVLAPAGLDLQVRGFVYSDDVPEDQIVRQRPEAGRVVKAGRGVGVVLSRGPERHPVPDVRGLPLEDARILLEEAGVKPEVALRLPRGLPGQVVAQGEDPGRLLPREAGVPLILSSGPAPVLLRMPRLEGGTLEDALSALDRLGLRLERIQEVAREGTHPPGRVLTQEPLGGFPVPRGSPVTLSVTGTTPAGLPQRTVWISRTMPPGFGRYRLEVLVEGADRTWVAAEEWVDAGATFRRSVLLRPGERVLLRIDGKDVDEEP
ncbi:MAG: PASTA domain-containing protein [Deferrisomatales bacterium]|nr:PASTA domain-containing protein [Deferrisomatales bacterium]